MIRLRSLRPREIRSIRHWAIELAVVVVGVLLALWAAEWAEGRRDELRMAELEEAMRAELADNYHTVLSQQASIECHVANLAALRRGLIENRGAWSGYESIFIYEAPSGERFERGIFGVSTDRLGDDAWEAAQESGLLAQMPPERLSLYRIAYARSRFLDEAAASLEARRNDLSHLIFPGTLSSDARAKALRDIIGAVNAVSRTQRYVDLEQMIQELGITFDDGQVERLKTLERRYQTELEQPCYRIPDYPASIRGEQ